MALTKKEIDFCRFYAALGNSREAAARAGYVLPYLSGIKLAQRQEIIEETERISEVFRSRKTVKDGLLRIAFGSVTDAVRLVLSPESFGDTENADLYNVSELKINKSGGIEVKFFDRIKALEVLSELGAGETSDGSTPFIEAIIKGAKAIDPSSRSECDEF